MNDWLPILIMIGLGAGFGGAMVGLFAAARSEKADAREAGAL